jgi:F0F1-type ATP synthase membrane subunit b/b'
MTNLAHIKLLLEKLPQFHKERGLKDNFCDYGKNVSESLQELEKAYKNLKSLETLEENETSKKKVLKEIKNAIKDAKNLKEEISDNAQNISKTATSNAVVRITDAHKSANKECRERWKNFIEKREEKWGKLANLVDKLPKTGGKEFKVAFDNLARYKTNIPQTNEEIQKIQQLRDELNSGVSKLGLEGAFGKFLEAAADGNALISELNKPEIKELLEKYNLWDSFRVQL